MFAGTAKLIAVALATGAGDPCDGHKPVRVTVDSYPDVVWQGRVDSIGQASGAEFALWPPQNASGNWVKVAQRIPVRIALTPVAGQPQLRAGMSAEVTVDTGGR